MPVIVWELDWYRFTAKLPWAVLEAQRHSVTFRQILWSVQTDPWPSAIQKITKSLDSI